MSDVTCSVEGCERRVLARGWCSKHYGKWLRLGDPLAGIDKGPGGICIVNDCEAPIKGHGYCNKHWQRWRTHGDPNVTRRVGRPICSVEGCERPSHGQGLCITHYSRYQRGDEVTAPIRPRIVTDDLAERLRFYAPIGAPDECWEWTGLRNKGYGDLSIAGAKSRGAHIVAWELHTGQSLPEGMLTRHTCDNPPCVNPSHLLLGTQADNNRDKVERGRCGHNGTFTHLLPDQVREIRALHASGVNMAEISRRFSRSPATIGRVVTRQVFANIA